MRGLVSSIVCLSTSLLTAAAIVAQQGGVGASDLLPFGLWTVPLAAIIGGLAHFMRAAVRLQPLLRVGIGLLVAPVVAVVWSIAPAVLLGPWVGAFSFPLLVPWLAASGGGLLVGAIELPASLWRSLAAIMAVSIGATAGGLLAEDALIGLLTGEVELHIVFVEWRQGEGVAPIAGDTDLLAGKERESLENLGLQGELIVLRELARGNGPVRRTTVVLESNLAGAIRLPVPSASGVVYVLTSRGTTKVPPDAGEEEATIWLTMPSEEDPYGRYLIEYASGEKVGGIAFWWEGEP